MYLFLKSEVLLQIFQENLKYHSRYFKKIRCKGTTFFAYMQEKREKSPNLSDFSLMV